MVIDGASTDFLWQLDALADNPQAEEVLSDCCTTSWFE